MSIDLDDIDRQILEILLQEFDADAETLRQDLLSFLQQAQALGIVRVNVPPEP